MIDGMGVVTGGSVAHQRASIDEIEAVSGPTQERTVADLVADPRVDEAFALHTCNRVEAYVVTGSFEVGRAVLAPRFAAVPTDAVQILDHEASLRHLLRIAGGLESTVIGDEQVLGQISRAHEDAVTASGVGPVFEECLTKAVRVGRRARTETAINDGVTCLGAAAACGAIDACRRPPETALVVGTGEMGTAAARRLQDQVDELLLANRTVSTAVDLAGSLTCDAAAVDLEPTTISAAVQSADVVVTATGSPSTVVAAEWFRRAGDTVVVDVARPRDVPPDVASLPNVTYHDLDTIESILDDARVNRQAAVAAVESLVEGEFGRLVDRYKRRRADAVIARMYKGGERIKRRELETAMNRLGRSIPDEQRQVIESLADAIVGQLLAVPTQSLRSAAEEDDWTTINAALQLFDPDVDGEALDRRAEVVDRNR